MSISLLQSRPDSEYTERVNMSISLLQSRPDSEYTDEFDIHFTTIQVLLYIYIIYFILAVFIPGIFKKRLIKYEHISSFKVGTIA